MLLFLKDGGPSLGDVHVNGAMGTRTQEDVESEAKAQMSGRGMAGIAQLEKRQLHRHDGRTAKSPFLYDPNVMGSLRPDQIPRFFGALTDSEKLPKKTVDLGGLHAMQDRVDPEKVAAIGEHGAGDKLPVVVCHQGRNYIADGHHRLTADWLAGKDTSEVRYKDLEPVSNVMKSDREFGTFFKVAGMNDDLGLVYGWGIVCKEGGQDYYDVQGNHIPEAAMVSATTDFMKESRMAGEQHERMDAGTIVHSFPMTAPVWKAMFSNPDGSMMGGLPEAPPKSGWMVAAAPDKTMLAKFKSGALTGFSIGGEHLELNGSPVGDVQ